MVLVDTNVLVYLLIEGDRTEAAQALFARDADWRSESFVLVAFSKRCRQVNCTVSQNVAMRYPYRIRGTKPVRTIVASS